MENKSLLQNRALVLEAPENSKTNSLNYECIKEEEAKYALILDNLFAIYSWYLKAGLELPSRIKESLIIFSGLDESFLETLKSAHNQLIGNFKMADLKLKNLFVVPPNTIQYTATSKKKITIKAEETLKLIEAL